MITDNDLLKINKAKQGFEFKKKKVLLINSQKGLYINTPHPSQESGWFCQEEKEKTQKKAVPSL